MLVAYIAADTTPVYDPKGTMIAGTHRLESRDPVELASTLSGVFCHPHYGPSDSVWLVPGTYRD
jgi:hypothetical protein